MKTQKNILRAAVAVAISGLSTTTFAAGFQLNEHSASGLGRAFAGDAAIAENASVIARNPASMSRFNGKEMSLALNYIVPEVDVEGTVTNLYAPAAGIDAVQDASLVDVTPDAVVPTAYFLMPYNDKVHLGIGAFSNYGLSTDYGDDYVGTEYANNVSITTFNIQPSVSYKLSDKLAVGLGINIVYAEAEMETNTPDYFTDIYVATAGAYPLPGGLTGVYMEGDDIAFGWNLGVLWEATPRTTLSLHYRSEVAVSFEGDAKSDLLPNSEGGLGFTDTGSLDIDLPSAAEVSINHKFDDKFSVQLSATLTGWSSFEELRAVPDNNPEALLKEENFEDSWRYALGGTYDLNEKWTLRAGYSYDQAAVGDEYRTISIPDADRHWLTLGASYELNDKLTLDFGYGHIFADDDAPVTEEFNVGTAESPLILTELHAELTSADVHIFSLQMNYHF